jgi:hypothetical protein
VTPLAPPEAPLTLAMPEPIKPVKERDAALALVPLKEDTRTAAEAQADRFIADLLHMDLTSGDFRSRVDSAFRLAVKRSATAHCSLANSLKRISLATPTTRLSRS